MRLMEELETASEEIIKLTRLFKMGILDPLTYARKVAEQYGYKLVLNK